jgi:hypothetical protein
MITRTIYIGSDQYGTCRSTEDTRPFTVIPRMLQHLESEEKPIVLCGCADCADSLNELLEKLFQEYPRRDRVYLQIRQWPPY